MKFPIAIWPARRSVPNWRRDGAMNKANQDEGVPCKSTTPCEGTCDEYV
jgi:hypothetical protein